MIEFYNNQAVSDNLKIASKGNQPKFAIDGKWYKMDYFGYEGAAEYLCSEILKHSNLTNFVSYNICKMSYQDEPINGCSSCDLFANHDGMKLITLHDLILHSTGKTIEKLTRGHSIEERIEIVVNKVEEITKLKGFGQYLTALLEFDALVLNEDRHFNNIAVLKSQTGLGYDFCPIFDNGAGFLSDITEYKRVSDIVNVEAKPFTKKFDKQMKACQALYGPQLQLISANYEYAFDEIESFYGSKIRDRMESIWSRQERLYNDFFVLPKGKEEAENEEEYLR